MKLLNVRLRSRIPLVLNPSWSVAALVLLAVAAPAQPPDRQGGIQEKMPPVKETAQPPPPPPAAPAGGAAADLPLGFNNNEPSIAVDPNNPLRVAVATYLNIRVSVDGGITFAAAVPASLPATHNNSRGGDSSLAFDSQGRLFWTYLAVTNGTSAPDIFLAQHNPTNGAVMPGYPINVTASAGVNLPAGPNSHDKQWLAIDSYAGSPFRDRIYMVWTDLTGAAVVRSAFSANQGQTWTLAAPLSVAAEGFPWPPHNSVAPNGNVYITYHSQTGSDASGADDLISGQVFILRSTDGGATFPQKNLAYGPGLADVTDNVQSQNNPIPGARFWLLGTGQAWVMADPFAAGRIYVVANDDPDNTPTGDPAKVYISVSTDYGTNWTAPTRIDRGPSGTFQVMPVANIDPITGCIAVHYYDNRRGFTNAAGRFLLDVYATVSHDGGVTFSPDFRINDTPFDPDPGAGCRFNCPTNPTTRIGEYNGVSVVSGIAYAVWTGNTFSGGNPAGQQTIFDRFICHAPVITIPGDVFFADTCVGSTNFETLYVCNTGNADLQVGPITSTNSQFAVVTPSSGYPVVISPDFCFPFRVRFSPTSPGDKETTFTVTSNDPLSPTNFVRGFGRGVGPTIATFMPNAGNFGDVCLGQFRDLNLTINNAGGCTLLVTNITSTLPAQFIVPNVVSFPLVIHPGDSVAVPIRFQPTGAFGPRTGTIVVGSTDPVSPNRMVSVSGNVPSGDVRVTGSTDFGEVCAGSINEKTISICNVGLCNLLVSNVSFVMPCPDFILVNNPFPAIVSHDFCVDVVIRFTPTSCGTKTCTLRIVTDDPDTPVILLTVTASSPCASIDVPPDLAFEPEVIQTVGSCNSELPFPISNTGFCPLVITAITIGGVDAGDFSFSGLPSFPIILEPGHIVGEGDLAVVFAPTVVDRDRIATITVTYVVDPISGATANVVRRIGGEGVRTGARVLVTHAGIPVANVERIHLQRINANRNRNRLDTQDNVNDLPLVTVIPAAPVEPFQYHREYGTVSNPIQLLPGAYQVTATAIINGKRRTLVVGFDVQTCDFNPTVVVDF